MTPSKQWSWIEAMAPDGRLILLYIVQVICSICFVTMNMSAYQGSEKSLNPSLLSKVVYDRKGDSFFEVWFSRRSFRSTSKEST